MVPRECSTTYHILICRKSSRTSQRAASSPCQLNIWLNILVLILIIITTITMITVIMIIIIMITMMKLFSSFSMLAACHSVGPGYQVDCHDAR